MPRRKTRELAGTHRVVIPDLRGHGMSEKVLHGHTVPNYAADLRAILAHLGVRRPVLVGWSMGAMVAYEFLSAYGPDSVAGLVVVDQPPSDFAWEDYAFGLVTLDTLRDMNEQLQLHQRAVAEEFARVLLTMRSRSSLAASQADPGALGREIPTGKPPGHWVNVPRSPGGSFRAW